MHEKLDERFAAAAARPPLALMDESSRRELAELLETVDAFDDLPGKWQAALLQAEEGSHGDTATHGTCCGHHPAPAPATGSPGEPERAA